MGKEGALTQLLLADHSLAGVVEAAPDGVVITDAAGGIILVNAQTEALFGYGRDELLRQPIETLLPERLRSAHVFHRAGYHANPRTRGMGTGLELYGRRRDGTEFPVEISLSPLTAERGILVTAIVRDVSERRRTEEERARLAGIVESSEDAIIGKTLDGTIASWNRGAEQIYGYSSDEVLGRPISILVPTEQPDDSFSILERILLGQRVEHYEAIRMRKDGRHIDVSLTVSPILDTRGEISGASIIARDVSERRRAEEEHRRLEKKLQETQRLESLGVLAGGIAHDFNNLLVGMLGNAGLALRELPSGSLARARVEQIETAALRAAELTTQMLAYTGQAAFVVQALDLSHMVEEITHLLERSISKNALLDFHLAAELPAVTGDAAQLRQVVMNLIMNASEALGDESGVITVTTSLVHADRLYLSQNYSDDALPEGPYVCLEVSDTGCGMDTETMERIFDPFFTTKAAGRGLGLAAVLGIVRGHGGAIRLYGEPGHGTTVKVLFPASTADLVTSDEPEADADWHSEGLFLVVDDEIVVQGISATILESAGFTVLSASDGSEAIEIVRQRRESLVGVLLDLTMPGLSTYETLQQLRRLRPDLPIVLTSGYSETEVTNQLVGERLVAFLHKPFRPRDLLAKVRQALEPA